VHDTSMRTDTHRKIAAACSSAALFLMLAACSGSSSPAAVAGSGAAGETSAAVAGPTAAVGLYRQLTGFELATRVPASSVYPSGFGEPADGKTNSGTTLETASAKYDVSSLSCSDLWGDANDEGFGESGFAADVYFNDAQTQGFVVEIRQFGAVGAAQAFYRGLTVKLPGCSPFAFQEDSGQFSDTVAPSLGTPPTGITSASASADVHVVLTGDQAATYDVVDALDGDDVVTVESEGIGMAEPAAPTPAALAEDMLTSVASANAN
jgi:hypothetical protein